jgi:hypothetical protein
LSMRRLHRRGLEYFFHLSLFIPDRDKRDKFRRSRVGICKL